MSLSEKAQTERAEEMIRRSGLPAEERRKLDREDNEKNHQEKVQRAAKVADMVKDRAKLVAAIQNDVTALATKLGKLTDQDLILYNHLFDPDCLFNDSPISQFNTYHWLKEFMIKKDMDFIGYILDGKFSAKPFTERMEDAARWALKFTKVKEKEKTGVGAIIGAP